MNKNDIKILTEAWGRRGEPEIETTSYGPFKLNPSEQNIVDAYIGRTPLKEFLDFIQDLDPDLYDSVMEQIVLMNIKEPSGM